jgi:hypothetical protein
MYRAIQFFHKSFRDLWKECFDFGCRMFDFGFALIRDLNRVIANEVRVKQSRTVLAVLPAGNVVFAIASLRSQLQIGLNIHRGNLPGNLMF